MTTFFAERNRMVARIVLVALLWTVAVFPGQADIIRLKNGNVVRGKIVKETKKKVIVEVPFGRLTFSRKEIARIKRDSNDIKNVIYQGKRLVSLGAYDNAIIYLKKELKAQPNQASLRKALAQAYFKAGGHYLEKGQVLRAREHLKQAFKHDPKLEVTSLLQKIHERERQAQKWQREAERYLQEKKGEEAAKKYLKLLEDFPEWEEDISQNLGLACVYAGQRYQHKRDFKSAIFYYNLALEYWPEVFPKIEEFWLSANINWIVQTYLYEGDWEQSEQKLLELLEVSPTSRATLFFLGMVYERLNQPGRAYFYYQRIVGGDENWSGKISELEQIRKTAQRESKITFLEGPSATVPENTVVSGNWSELRTQHFRIFHYNPQIAERIANALEYHWAQIQYRLSPSSWNGSWKIYCNVYIHPSKQQYLSATGMSEWSEGVTKIDYSSGRLKSHAIHLYQTAPLLSSAVIPHELTHVMYPWFIKYRGRLPLWLNEGIAMCSEPPFRRRNRMRIARMAMRSGSLIPTKKLWSMRRYPGQKKQVEIYYAQSFSMVYFLLRLYGKDKLYEFVKALRKNSTETALRNVYQFASAADFEHRWLSVLISEK